MTFEEWWYKKDDDLYVLSTVDELREFAEEAWHAAQAAERERILQIVDQVGIQGNHNAWFDCCDTIVERIGK